MTATRPRAGSRTARSHHGNAARIGLALAAWGPLGGTYEVGTLLALADSLEGVDFNAIEASAAFPGLFPPVEIDGALFVDGALNKTLHASLALDAGVDLLLCVSPLVPFDVDSAHRRGRLSVAKVHRGGLPRVLSQTFREIIHSRMKVGMDKYTTRYPNADVVQFEPAREDVEMFHAKIFSYARRRRLCALAFDSTRASRRARAHELSPLLARHGVRLNTARLADDRRRVTDAVCDPRPLHTAPLRRRGLRSIRRDLEHALTQLEREVESLRPALAH